MEEDKIKSLFKRIHRIQELSAERMSNQDNLLKEYQNRITTLEADNTKLVSMIKLVMDMANKQSEILTGLVEQQNLLMAEIQRKR